MLDVCSEIHRAHAGHTQVFLTEDLYGCVVSVFQQSGEGPLQTKIMMSTFVDKKGPRSWTRLYRTQLRGQVPGLEGDEERPGYLQGCDLAHVIRCCSYALYAAERSL